MFVHFIYDSLVAMCWERAVPWLFTCSTCPFPVWCIGQDVVSVPKHCQAFLSTLLKVNPEKTTTHWIEKHPTSTNTSCFNCLQRSLIITSRFQIFRAINKIDILTDFNTTRQDLILNIYELEFYCIMKSRQS